MILSQIKMNEQNRQNLISQFLMQTHYCPNHPQQAANLIITHNDSSTALICTTCLDQLSQKQNKQQFVSTHLKYTLAQIHQTCNTLTTALTTCVYVDHHINLIRTLAKKHFRSSQALLQTAISHFFEKTRDLLTGRYFHQFYFIVSCLNDVAKQANKKAQSQKNSLLKQLLDYIGSFQQLSSSYEEYDNLSSEDKLTGQYLIIKIRKQVSQIHRQITEKALGHNKQSLQQNGILQILNPALNYKHYRFSSTLLHYSLKSIDCKKVKIIELQDNDFTLLALVQPSIGHKKKTIKFRIDGIKGWVAVGIAIRRTVEQNAFRFEQGLQHGTFQVSYDGYTWTDDQLTNQQYISWSYKEGDTISLTVNPSSNELTYLRNDQSSAAMVLKYRSEKEDKLYFCVSVNYNEDQVTIVS